MNQFDWFNTQKKETMEVPQNRRFYFEAWSSSLLAGLWVKGGTLARARVMLLGMSWRTLGT
jgi:hypothetical protein